MLAMFINCFDMLVLEFLVLQCVIFEVACCSKSHTCREVENLLPSAVYGRGELQTLECQNVKAQAGCVQS